MSSREGVLEGASISSMIDCASGARTCSVDSGVSAGDEEFGLGISASELRAVMEVQTFVSSSLLDNSTCSKDSLAHIR